jgi:hypothetical protein
VTGLTRRSDELVRRRQEMPWFESRRRLIRREP